MSHTEQLHGLHVLTDSGRILERRVPMTMVEIVERAIIGGASVIQLREKELPDSEMIPLAFQIKEQIGGRALFLINDRVNIALEVDADGVHVGQDDMKARDVRKNIGRNKILGVSASTVEEAIRAIDDRADYIGVGPIFPTTTKKDVKEPIGISGLREIRKITKPFPLITIGGINIHNVGSLAPFCDGIAVITEVMIADDPAQTTMQLTRILQSQRV